MFDFAELATAFKSLGQEPISRSSCYEWSIRRRVMGAPFPGLYTTKYHPWCKGLLDSKATFNVSLKSAQAGYSEAMLNRALYTIDVLKRSVLYVLPTTLTAQDFSKSRFTAAINESEYLKNMFSETNSVGLKQAGSTNLYIRGSRGDSNLKSVPASLLVLDEYDEMDARAVQLALERLSGQIHKEVWFVSTPTIDDYGVAKEYLTTTQEHFYFKCPSCSKQTELIFPECLEVCGEHINDPDVKKSFLKCKECGNTLHQQDKPVFLSTGEWQPTYTNGDPDRRGFSINQLYSYTISAPELAQAFIRSKTDEYAAQEWANSKLGKPYVGLGARVTKEQVSACVKDHSIHDPRPTDASRLITQGCDQGRIGYSTVVEYFCDDLKEPHTGYAKVLNIEAFDQNSYGFDRPAELMREWQVQYCIVDADPEITIAREFARKFRKYAGLSRYRAGVTGSEKSVTDEDTGAPMYTVDRSYWLGIVLNRFKTHRIDLPRETTQEFKDHIMAAISRWEKLPNGDVRQVFVSTGADHFLHSLVYSELALAVAASKYSVSGDIIRKP